MSERPLTVADRPLEKGDRFETPDILTRGSKQYLVEEIRMVEGQKRIGLFECAYWFSDEDLQQARYVSRSDAGPITVEEQAK